MYIYEIASYKKKEQYCDFQIFRQIMGERDRSAIVKESTILDKITI